MLISTLRALVLTVSLTALAHSQTVVFVDTSATGANDGTSWTDAFPDLQDGLAAAAGGDELWVAAGTYVTSTTDATVSFVLPEGVALYGGFAGVETTLAERDWSTNITLLSGDVAGDDAVGPGGWVPTSPNAGHVVDASGVSIAAILDGFTVSFGNTGPIGTGAGHPLMYGSGIYADGGSPTVRHCTIRYNQAAFAHGGGMYVYNGSPEITDCQFLDNYVHLGDGGGLFVAGNSVPIVEDCVFARNTTVGSSGDTTGGGMSNESSQAVTVSRCLFENNTSRPFYSISDYTAYGGGLHNFSAPITVEDCVFTGNAAQYGAGFMTWDSATLVNCLFYKNKPTPWEGSLGGYGGDGTVMINDFSPGVMALKNCTIADNDGEKYPGVMVSWNASATIENCVIWGNDAKHPETSGGWKEQAAGDFEASWSCIATIFAPHAPGEDPIDPEDLPGCIDLDPAFADGPGANYRVAAGSPCIDAGNNAAIPAGVVTDLDGLARFVDDPSTPDTGLGTAPLIDMGAFEFGGTMPIAEIVPYGCGVNPPGSLTVVSGLPQIGTTVVLGLDNPLGTQAPGSLPFLGLATAPDPAFPCGTPIPGFGMSGTGAVGELLLSLTGPNPFQVIAAGPWLGAGLPADASVPIPPDPVYAGLSVFAQGVLLDPSPAAPVKIGLTTSLELRIGL